MSVCTLSTVCPLFWHFEAPFWDKDTLLSSTIPVVKNPLSPVEHPGGVGVNCEMFELGVEQFVVCFVPV